MKKTEIGYIVALSRRLVRLRKAFELNQKVMAERAGTPFRTWQAYENAERTPSAALYQRLYEMGVNTNWLVSGDGPIFRDDRTAAGTMDADGMVLIPRFEIRPGAGAGAFADTEEQAGFIALSGTWVRNVLGCNPADLVMLEAGGDSMEPTIHDRDPMIVNRADRELHSDMIYVLRQEDALLVKRVQRQLSGDIMLISDNPAYKPETLSPALAEGLHVIGRVMLDGRIL